MITALHAGDADDRSGWLQVGIVLDSEVLRRHIVDASAYTHVHTTRAHLTITVYVSVCVCDLLMAVLIVGLFVHCTNVGNF